ncbi:MAG: PaaI family thioesterase [Burkholderiales bacterium]|nr:PaaI family thioesterase [Burkholderiales bacterium]
MTKRPAPNPFGELIGIAGVRSAAGRSRCHFTVLPALLNPHRVLHGGVMFSVMDTNMGDALYTLLEKGESCATIEIKINYLKPVARGRLVCTTRVVQRGRRIAVIESDLRQGRTVVAKALGTFAIFARLPAPDRPGNPDA